MPIGDCAMANELRPASGLEFGAFQSAHPKTRRMAQIGIGANI
jgi:hypothetical protein